MSSRSGVRRSNLNAGANASLSVLAGFSAGRKFACSIAVRLIIETMRVFVEVPVTESLLGVQNLAYFICFLFCILYESAKNLIVVQGYALARSQMSPTPNPLLKSKFIYCVQKMSSMLNCSK
jgi:hypothetical protein